MDRLRNVLGRVVGEAMFRHPTLVSVDSSHVRRLWDERRFGDRAQLDAESQRLFSFRDHPSTDDIEIAPRLLGQLIGELEPMLAKYIQPEGGGLGNGVFLLRGGESRYMHPTVEEYARIVAIAGARIGAARTVELLGGWLAEEPLRIRKHAVIEGVRIDSPLEGDKTIVVTQMPESTSDFPVAFPYFPWVGFESFVREPVVSVDFEVRPALYRPEPGEDSWERQETVPANARLRGFSFDRLCDTMALVVDNHVGWRASWDDPGDLDAFMLTPASRSKSKPESGSGGSAIAQAHLDEAVSLYEKRAGLRELDIAIARWVKSKRPGPVEDGLIELRIALEATFIDGWGELRYRTALHGATHGNKTPAERRQDFKTLNDIYNDASRVVHGGRLKDGIRSRKRLDRAQRICRQSMLKIINDGRYPDWTELVLFGAAAGGMARRGG